MRHFRMDSGLLSAFFYICLLLLLASYLIVHLDRPERNTLSLRADQGQFALTFWYPNTSPPLSLAGQWLSFPDQLLNPERVIGSIQHSTPTSLPDIWQRPGPRHHVTTYTLELTEIPQQIELGLLIPEVKNSFRLFLDEREIASGGHSSVNPDEVEGYFGDKVVYLGMLPDRARLTLQVSNFGHARGGVHDAMLLAPYDYWQRYYRSNILIEGVVICLALLAGVLMLLEFAQAPRHKELLWIALFALVLAGYTGTTGLGTFATLFGDFPWQIAVRLEYIGFACAIPLFINWLGALYQEDMRRWRIHYLTRFSCVLLIIILLTPSVLFTELLSFLLLYMSLCILVTVVIMVRLFILNRSGIRILTFGAFALLASIMHDLGAYLGLLADYSLMPMGVLVFLISQVGFLAFFRTHEQLWIIQLNHQLQDTTATLENRINERNQELQLRIRELEQKRREYHRLKSEDELTGLSNRHAFFHQILRRIERSHRANFSVVMVDIDHFKQINDQYGREFAEAVLCRVAQYLLKECEGRFDWVPARYGGDEFVFWLGGVDYAQAVQIAQKMQQDIARIQIPVFSQPGEMFRFTVSTGIASSDQEEVSLDSLLARSADDVHRQRALRDQQSEGSGIHSGIHSPSSDSASSSSFPFKSGGLEI